MLDSLVAGSRNTLCLNLVERELAAEDVVREHLASKGTKVTLENEPSATQFASVLENLAGKTVVVTFARKYHIS